MLTAVLASDSGAEQTLAAYFRLHPQYGSHDRRLIADTVYGCLRRLRSLGYALGHPERPNWRITREEARARIERWSTQPTVHPPEAVYPGGVALPAAIAADLPDWLYDTLCAERGTTATQDLARR